MLRIKQAISVIEIFISDAREQGAEKAEPKWMFVFVDLCVFGTYLSTCGHIFFSRQTNARVLCSLVPLSATKRIRVRLCQSNFALKMRFTERLHLICSHECGFVSFLFRISLLFIDSVLHFVVFPFVFFFALCYPLHLEWISAWALRLHSCHHSEPIISRCCFFFFTVPSCTLFDLRHIFDVQFSSRCACNCEISGHTHAVREQVTGVHADVLVCMWEAHIFVRDRVFI